MVPTQEWRDTIAADSRIACWSHAAAETSCEPLGVEPVCTALQVAPSTYYAAKRREREPSARAVRGAVRMQVLLALWVANRKVCGARKLSKAVRRAGHEIGPMPSPVETTAAMTEPAEQPTPDGSRACDTGTGSSAGLAGSAAGSAPAGGAAARRGMSPNAVISVFGGLATTLLGALIGLMMWQFSSLGNRIDAQGVRIENLGAELRAEMQAGFREVNAILLDHTGRLARLETAAGLHRGIEVPESPSGNNP